MTLSQKLSIRFLGLLVFIKCATMTSLGLCGGHNMPPPY